MADSRTKDSYLLFPILDGDLLRLEVEYKYKEKETIKRIQEKWKQSLQLKIQKNV